MSKILWWILGSLLVLVFIGVAFWLGLNYNNPEFNFFKNAGDSRSASNAQEKTGVNDSDKNLATDTADETDNQVDQAKNGSDWAIFKNYAYKYLIEYPQTATVENAGTDASEQGKAPKDAKCVKISNKYVNVTILARGVDPTTECLPTGYGTEWGQSPDEAIQASGADYTAKGMHTESASAGYYQDAYMFTAASGEKILYGITVNEKYDDQMTKAQAKDIVHKMVASFNPAE